jgi:beta-lactamase regulating signal transducer with metallopeptidase domain
MDALLLAVLNALWQGAALIGLVALTLRAGLRRNATTACVVWSITFLVVALLPALDLALARPAVAPLTTAAPPAVAPAAVAAAASAAATGARAGGGPQRTMVRTARVSAPDVTAPGVTGASAAIAAVSQAPQDVIAPIRTVIAERVRELSMRVGSAATAFARGWGIALFSVWALVAGTLLVRLARGYAAVARMKRDATPLDDPRVLALLRSAGHRRRATVARSLLVDVPCAVGFRRPMILIPQRLAASLDGDDLARVVLHESAHLQRYDDWLNALEQVVCALQFFQPALHVARRGIDFEREVACDDRVLEDAGEPLRYAECLARIVSRGVRGSRVAVAPGFMLRRAQVVGRVRRIVDRSRDASPHLRFAAVALTAVVLAATLGIARLQVPVVAAAVAATPVVVAVPAVPAKPARAVLVAKPMRSNAVPTRSAHAAVAAKRAVAVKPASSVKPAVAAKPLTAARAITTTRAATATRTSVLTTIAPVASVRVVSRLDAPVAPRTPCPLSDALVAPAPPASVTRSVSVESGRAPEAPRSAPASAIAPVFMVSVTTPAATAAVPRIAPLARVAYQSTYTVKTPRAVEAPAAPPTVHGGGDLLEAIDDSKYPHPSVDDLIALRNQGVSGDYVRRMGALRPRPALHDMLALAVQGVTPEYVASLNHRLATEPSVGQIIALRVQGVSGSWLDGLASTGYPKLSVDDAVSLAVQGISVSYVRALMDAGLRNLTPSQLVALRVQGIDGSFVRRLAAHGYHNLSTDELVRLKVTGFEP